MKSLHQSGGRALGVALAYAACLSLCHGQFAVVEAEPSGTIRWQGALSQGVCRVEFAKDVRTAAWTPSLNFFTTGHISTARLRLEQPPAFFRFASSDVSGTPQGFTNLVNAFGMLETIAGAGSAGADATVYWVPAFEGGPATNALLSRPHSAFATPSNDIVIVDEGNMAVELITRAGTIHTIAGTHVRGFNGDGPAPATNLMLNIPNSGWMMADGTFFILDTGNLRVRRLDTNGIMSTVFTVSFPVSRGLWVNRDASTFYFSAYTNLMRWTATGGVSLVRGGFADLANITGDDERGFLYVGDRNEPLAGVYRLRMDGSDLVRIAGNGMTTGSGGDGYPALETALNRPRGAWFLPNGGFLVNEHTGDRIWYVDPAGIIHLWINGDGTSSTTGTGDGEWFYANPLVPKLTKVRSVTTDRQGNIIIVENDRGFVRRVRFESMPKTP